MSNANAQTIDKGLRQARQLIMQRLSSRLYSIGRRIAEEEIGSKEYLGFTGNAQTSYTSQVWVDGMKVSEYCTGDNQPDAIHEKVGEGEYLRLEEPYEGEARKVKGEVPIDHAWAIDSLNAIDREKPDVKKGIAVRFAVGVEYGEYIGNPLDGMMQSALYDINEYKLRIDVHD